MRIGLFGGTFNPIHIGHLRAALEVVEGLGLDRVYLIPAAVPPHKAQRGLAPAADRLQMIALAVEGETRLAASDVEIRREGPSYTVDTVRHFRGAMPGGTEVFLIVGMDAFLEIDTWKSYRELLALAPVVVISRPEGAGRGTPADERTIADFIRARIAPDAVRDEALTGFSAPGIQGVTLFPVTALDVSSRRIRELVAAGRSIGFLVPEPVRHYIQTKGLYV